MTEEQKSFSQMKKEELYETVRQFRSDVQNMNEMMELAERRNQQLERMLEGLDEKVQRMDQADAVATKIISESDEYRANLDKIRRGKDEVDDSALQSARTAKTIARLEGEIKTSEQQINRAGVTINEISNKGSKLRQDLSELLTDKKKELEILTNSIKALLPGATVANLAYSFRQAKFRYGDEPMDRTDDKDLTLWKSLVITVFSINNLINLALYLGFVSSLCLIPALFIFGSKLGLEPLQSLSFDALIDRFLAVLPILWFAAHLNRQINLRAKLYEEYNYKERLATTYLGFLAQRNTTEQQKGNFTDQVLVHLNKPPSITKSKVYSDSFFEQFFRAFGRSEKSKDTTPSNPAPSSDESQ
jgi:hypothetical protein